jgi:hypothetical protein
MTDIVQQSARTRKTIIILKDYGHPLVVIVITTFIIAGYKVMFQ